MSGITLKHDAIFHVLLGTDARLIQEANARSATRIAKHLNLNTQLLLLREGERSTTHAQVIFIVFLYVDGELRREVLQGTALSVKTRKLCEYHDKVGRLFEGLYENVVSAWTKKELNTPGDLVQSFRQEYLVS
eukprot:3763379-Rhodomonas_salina.2